MFWQLLFVALAAVALWLALRAGRWRTTAPKARDSSDLGFLPEEFVVFDLETTGLNPSRNKIIEIGAIRVPRVSIGLGQTKLDTYQSLVRISGKVPAKITEITGIDDAMLARDGESLADAIDGFLQFVGNRRMVAFNAEFDVAFLNAAIGPTRLLRNPVSCALQMSRRAFPGLPSYRLSELARSVDAGSAHRAIADCHRALIVYIHAAERLRSMD